MSENNCMLQRVNLYLLGFTDLLLSFCSDGIDKKQKNAHLSAALLSFCLVCEISLCTSFQTYLRRDFVTTLYLISFFLPPSHLYTLPASPTTKYFHLEEARTHFVFWHQRPLGQKFPTQHPAVCSLLLPLLWESGFIPREFSFLLLKIVFYLTFRLPASSEGKERKDGHYRNLRRLDKNYQY